MQADAYQGDEKLVLCIDLGTTMTAISYVHLQPDIIPQVLVVNRWPAQEDQPGNCKVHTAVRYTAAGAPVAFGTAALEEPADNSKTKLARYFKLHLHPADMRAECALSAPPLPPKVTLPTIYRDFLRFVFGHSRQIFKDNNGDDLWERLEPTLELVYAIPNGWAQSQQTFFRTATVAAGILPSNHNPDRVMFVSEAEASVQFAIQHMQMKNFIEEDSVFAVVDAGGSTVDTTMYQCDALSPQLRLSEVTSSECVQSGSMIVDKSFEHFIREYLAESKFCKNEDIMRICSLFESKTKRLFKGVEDSVVIQFGRNRDTDLKRSIKMGRLTLQGEQVTEVFEPHVRAAVATIHRSLKRVEDAGKSCKSILLVGGFAESPFLRRELQENFSSKGIRIIYSHDEPTRKAAAVGAAYWRMKQVVSARASRCTFGTTVVRDYDSEDATHHERADTAYIDATGKTVVPWTFNTLVSKNQIVDNDDSVLEPFIQHYDSLPDDLGNFTMDVLVSDSEDPGYWACDAEGVYMPGIRRACRLTADLSGLTSLLKRMKNSAGYKYWKVEYSVELYFGQTTLSASLVWEEDGVMKRGPVTIIADSLH